MVTQARLKEYLTYDPDTGVFTHKFNTTRRYKGGIAGSLQKSTGYKRIYIDGKENLEHRLAWLYMNGEFPAKGMQIDHINHIRTDNRIENLRVVSSRDNARNALKNDRNWSGVTGIRWSKSSWQWMVSLGKKHIGSYDTMAEAFNELVKARKADDSWNYSHGAEVL